MNALPSQFYPSALDLAAQQAAASMEYIRLKCFVYKFNPPFTDNGPQSNTLSVLEKYSIPLQEQYFSKYDISNYVIGYTFDQNIYENTFNWSVTLQDHIVTQADFLQVLNADVPNQPILNNSVTLPVTDSSLGTAGTDVQNTASGLVNISNYEAVTPTPFERLEDVNPAYTIESAKLERGNAEAELTDKLGGGAKVTGIRLSDLLQMYDMVSIFLYKENAPLESLTGTLITVPSNTIILSDSGTPITLHQFVPDSTGGGQPLTPQNLQQETVLLSPYPTNPGKTVFSNEFNGFVMNKTFTRDVSGVDQVTISGNGITRLLGATRRIIKPSLLQNAIYTELSSQNIDDISGFQTPFAGRPLLNIVTDLLSFVYNISFDYTTSSDNTTVTSVNNCWFDISALQVGNQLQSNIFTVPPYLLGVEMKRRLFNYRQIIPLSGVTTLANGIQSQYPLGATPQQLTTFLNGASGQFTYFNGTQPVQFDSTVLNLQTYFKFLAAVYEFFNPKLQTPFEVLDDVKKVSFAEIFERPDGVIVVRNPQYNNINTDFVSGSTQDVQSILHFSSNYGVSNSSYTETVNDLVSRMKVNYMIDGLPQAPLAIQEWAFIDGKLLLQYGFLEAAADANPNAKNDPNSNDVNSLTRQSILINYCEYFLRYHNAQLKTGTITMDLDNTIRVGDTWFDVKNNKFGYIIGLSKSIVPGQAAMMTLNLSFVRDAYNTDPSTQKGENLNFSILPTLEDINGD